jgi:hypothetical protein
MLDDVGARLIDGHLDVKNLVLIETGVAGDLNRVPEWHYRDNPFVTLIRAARPDRVERRRFAMMSIPRFFGGEAISPERLAREACQVELEMVGSPIGVQDQYIAAHGGITRLDFGRYGSVNVEAVPISTTSALLYGRGALGERDFGGAGGEHREEPQDTSPDEVPREHDVGHSGRRRGT